MALGHFSGLTTRLIQENSRTTASTAKVYTLGRTPVSSPECGVLTRCMAMVLSFGLTVGSISVTTAKIKRKDMENSSGQMAGATEENGLMASNTAKELMSQALGKKSMESGGMAKG